MDVLTDVLNALELKGWLSSRRELAPPWRFDFVASQDMIFHMLSFGGGYLSVEGDSTPLWVEDGSVLLFPYGHAHSIFDELTSPLTQVVNVDYDAQREYHVFPCCEGEGQKMILLCGAFHLEHPGDSPLLHSLPKVIHIPAEHGRKAQAFTDLVHFIARESAGHLAGREVMLRRLTEMLFIQIVRFWINQQTQATGGWVTALGDQPISTALGLIHQFPERGWKVKELAEAAALSRSAFSARFTRLVGEPPIKYLTRWRMHKATRLLKNDVEMDKITELLGYESEVAFRKAFKREIGIPPARYRKLGVFAHPPKRYIKSTF
jgi:AraC-like DNA-binding protein